MREHCLPRVAVLSLCALQLAQVLLHARGEEAVFYGGFCVCWGVFVGVLMYKTTKGSVHCFVGLLAFIVPSAHQGAFLLLCALALNGARGFFSRGGAPMGAAGGCQCGGSFCCRLQLPASSSWLPRHSTNQRARRC